MNFDLIHISELLSFDTPEAGPLTPQDISKLKPLNQAYVQVREGKIAAYGSMQDYLAGDVEAHSLAGKTLLPGLVDAHNHLVFGGSREHELVERIERSRNVNKGQRMAGGINYTVQKTREASREELVQGALKRLDRMLAYGTTTSEAKSGYGLSLEQEIKLLQAIQQADRAHPIDLVPTFLGAHAVPAGLGMEEYVSEVLSMIPVVAQKGLAEFCDVFCEEGFFSVEDSRRILSLAHQHGLALKVHADELAASGGAQLAAELKAVSADHLQYADRKTLAAMKAAGTLPVILPGVSFYLDIPYVDIEALRELELPMVLATDLNPGGSYCESLLFMVTLACTRQGMLPIEALAAVTRNAAYAVNRGQLAGQIAVGRPADLVVLDAPNHQFIPYRFGINLVSQVYKAGRACLGEH